MDSINTGVLRKKVVNILKWLAENPDIFVGVKLVSGKSNLPPVLKTPGKSIFSSWFRASWLYINKIHRHETVCRCLFTAKLLYIFRVFIAPIIRITSKCNCSFCSEISPTRCNNCVFILRNGFTLHVSGDNLTIYYLLFTIYYWHIWQKLTT